MNADEIKVLVFAPAAQIVTRGRPIDISDVFLQDEFELRIWLNRESYVCRVTLPEWLEALTQQLKMDGDGGVHRVLTLSGEVFSSHKEDKNYALKIFDVAKSEAVVLKLTVDQAKILHSVVLDGFVKAIRQAQDCSVELQGMENVSL